MEEEKQEVETESFFCENEINYFLKQYEMERDIDLHNENMSRWNSCLLYIYNNVFKNNNRLKSNELKYTPSNKRYKYSTLNCYDMVKVCSVCDLYISLCYEYMKEISLLGFSKLTGIYYSTFYDWHSKYINNNSIDNNKSFDNSDCSTFKSYDIYQKLQVEREESLSNKLYSSSNPVGTIAILNHNYNWNNTSSQQLVSGPSQTITEIQEKYITENGETGKETGEK